MNSYVFSDTDRFRYVRWMDVAVTCPSCKLIAACNCRESLLSYFAILERVQKRVLTQQASSSVANLPVASAGVDKLEAYFTETINLQCVVARSIELGYKVEQVRLRERTPFTKISREDQFIHLRPSVDRSCASSMITNPNRFGTWSSFLEFIRILFGPSAIETARITRLDLNLDFACSLPELLRSIDIKNKRWGAQFLERSGARTGMIVGKGDESVEIYDKTKESNLETPLSRLELRLRGRKLPTRSITEVPDQVLRTKLLNGLEGVSVTFRSKPITDCQVTKLNAFKMILNRDGIHFAKRALNQDRNFDRNFNKLVEIKQWTEQPTQIFQKSIDFFFKPQCIQCTPRLLNEVVHFDGRFPFCRETPKHT